MTTILPPATAEEKKDWLKSMGWIQPRQKLITLSTNWAGWGPFFERKKKKPQPWENEEKIEEIRKFLSEIWDKIADLQVNNRVDDIYLNPRCIFYTEKTFIKNIEGPGNNGDTWKGATVMIHNLLKANRVIGYDAGFVQGPTMVVSIFFRTHQIYNYYKVPSLLILKKETKTTKRALWYYIPHQHDEKGQFHNKRRVIKNEEIIENPPGSIRTLHKYMSTDRWGHLELKRLEPSMDQEGEGSVLEKVVKVFIGIAEEKVQVPDVKKTKEEMDREQELKRRPKKEKKKRKSSTSVYWDEPKYGKTRSQSAIVDRHLRAAAAATMVSTPEVSSSSHQESTTDSYEEEEQATPKSQQESEVVQQEAPKKTKTVQQEPELEVLEEGIPIEEESKRRRRKRGLQSRWWEEDKWWEEEDQPPVKKKPKRKTPAFETEEQRKDPDWTPEKEEKKHQTRLSSTKNKRSLLHHFLDTSFSGRDPETGKPVREEKRETEKKVKKTEKPKKPEVQKKPGTITVKVRKSKRTPAKPPKSPTPPSSPEWMKKRKPKQKKK